MPSKLETGVCDVCGHKGSVSLAYAKAGKKLCSTCMGVYCDVTRRLEPIAQAVIDLDKTWELIAMLPVSGDASIPAAENAHFDAIANVVGYDGESRAGLVATVKEAFSTLTKAAAKQSSQLEHHRATNARLTREIEALQARPKDGDIDTVLSLCGIANLAEFGGWLQRMVDGAEQLRGSLASAEARVADLERGFVATAGQPQPIDNESLTREALADFAVKVLTGKVRLEMEPH